MDINDYHIITRWHVRGSLSEVRSVLFDACDLPRWWSSVNLDTTVLEPGDESGWGR